MAGYIGDDHPAQSQIGIDADGQGVIEAMGLPGQGEASGPGGPGEFGPVEADMILDLDIGRPGHQPPREAEAAIALQRLARAVDQRVLAGPGRADHQHQYTRLFLAQLTRCPARHTARTAGSGASAATRTRSARLPGAISPRSSSPAARAGLSVTVARAWQRSSPSPRCGNRKAACNSAKGT